MDRTSSFKNSAGFLRGQAGAGKSAAPKRGSIMDMILETKTEVMREKHAQADESYARRVQEAEAEDLRRRREEEQKSEAFAQKLQAEEEDLALAEHLHHVERRELKKRQAEVEAQMAKDEKIARKFEKSEQSRARKLSRKERKASLRDMKAARKLQKQELRLERQASKKAEMEEKKTRDMERKSEKLAQRIHNQEAMRARREEEERARRAEADERLASKLQSEELATIARHECDMRTSWMDIQVDVEEEKCGVAIAVKLPNVRRMEVDLDEDENIVFVSAAPKSGDKLVEKLAPGCQGELRKIVEKSLVDGSTSTELKPIQFEIHLSDFVDGCPCAEEIESEYRADEGMLQLRLLGMRLKSSKKTTNFRTSLLGRLRSMFTRRKSSSRPSASPDSAFSLVRAALASIRLMRIS